MSAFFQKNSSPTKTKVVAHRGGALLAPENTLAAIKNALSLCVDRIEIDVQITKDNVVIVIHDETLDRTTNKQGYIRKLTYKEILTADAGSKFSLEFKNEKIPSLDEVMSVIAGKCLLLIEIKNTYNELIEKEVVRQVQKYCSYDWCVIQSFNYDSICKVYNIDKSIKTGILFERIPYSKIEKGFIDLSFVSEINIHKNFANPKSIEYIHNAGKQVYVWTVNDETDMMRMISLGVDGIITDDPRKLKLLLV